MSKTHDEIMKLMLLEGSGHQLVDVVSQALKERDAVIDTAENERDTAIIERDKFREENRRLINKFVHTPTTEQIDAAVKERDAAREALTTISQGIDPYADQLQNWIAGQIDTALGNTTTLDSSV